MAITPTDTQNKAIKEIVAWHKSLIDPRIIYVLAGYAGTGKSTIISFAIQELGIKKVAFVAYTGMAASVLLRKGNKGAKTIHKLIYNAIPIESEDGNTKFIFELKETLDDDVELIVVDELSMVNEEMMRDLLVFGKKILGTGDPGQLPPITGGNHFLDNPDFFLTEVLRQALDNPIIYVSMLAREKKAIQYGMYGDTVQVVRENELHEDMFRFSDQIIAGRNKTVQAINKFYRKEILKIETPFPIIGDKVICLKNDWNYSINENFMDVPLVNGLIGQIDGSLESLDRSMLYKMGFKPSFCNDATFKKLYVDKTRFLSEQMQQSCNPKSLFLFRKPIIESFGIQEFDFGYCITCHKSQGSEFDNVLGIVEVLNRQMHNRWLYTLITRAKEKLILVI